MAIGRCLRDERKLLSGMFAFRWCRQMWHWDDGAWVVLVFECVQQGELAQLNGTRSCLVDLRYKVESDCFALDCPFHVGKGVAGITVARPLHQVVHKGGNALGAVKPSFGEAITIEAGYMAETHGQPRVELLGEPTGQKNTTKIIPFETAEPQANKEDTGPEG